MTVIPAVGRSDRLPNVWFRQQVGVVAFGRGNSNRRDICSQKAIRARRTRSTMRFESVDHTRVARGRRQVTRAVSVSGCGARRDFARLIFNGVKGKEMNVSATEMVVLASIFIGMNVFSALRRRRHQALLEQRCTSVLSHALQFSREHGNNSASAVVPNTLKLSPA